MGKKSLEGKETGKPKSSDKPQILKKPLLAYSVQVLIIKYSIFNITLNLQIISKSLR